MLDRQLVFSNKQAITVTAVSTDKVSLLGTPLTLPTGQTVSFVTDTLGNTVENDAGKTEELDVLITVTEAFTAAGAATLTFALVVDDDEALGSPTTLMTTAAIGKATLIPGYQARMAIPAGAAQADRFMGISYTVATGPMTAGRITAAIVNRHEKPNAPGIFR